MQESHSQNLEIKYLPGIVLSDCLLIKSFKMFQCLEDIKEHMLMILMNHRMRCGCVDFRPRAFVHFSVEWISQIGKWNIRRIIISGLQDKYDRYSLYLNELMSKKILERREKNPDRRIFGTLVIIDLAGFNLRQHGCIRCMQQILKLDIETEDAYSERPYKSLMINAPRILDEFFHTVKSRTSLSPGHPYQYEVHDFDQRKWQQVLLKYVDRDQLPTQYGGTCITNLL